MRDCRELHAKLMQMPADAWPRFNPVEAHTIMHALVMVGTLAPQFRSLTAMAAGLNLEQQEGRRTVTVDMAALHFVLAGLTTGDADEAEAIDSHSLDAAIAMLVQGFNAEVKRMIDEDNGHV